MKKFIAFLIIFFFLIFNISPILACSMRSAFIELNDNINTCELSPDIGRSLGEISLIWDKNQDLNETKFTEVCPNISIRESDKNQVINLLKKVRLYSGDGTETYGNKYILQQNDTQYIQLKKEIQKINLNLCDCSKKAIIGRIDNWTAYSTETKKTCTFSTACYQPPFFCPSSAYFLHPFSLALGDPFAIGTAILLLFLIIIKIVLIIRKKIKSNKPVSQNI